MYRVPVPFIVDNIAHVHHLLEFQVENLILWPTVPKHILRSTQCILSVSTSPIVALMQAVFVNQSNRGANSNLGAIRGSIGRADRQI